MSLVEHRDWQGYAKGKWVLWDTCAIIRVIQYDAYEVFDKVVAIGGTNTIITPIKLELLATQNYRDFARRSDVIARYMEFIAFGTSQLELAETIQLPIASISQPKATDVFLAATLASYNSELICLVTENLKDFPSPYFSRECYLTLEGDTTSASLAMLSTDAARFR